MFFEHMIPTLNQDPSGSMATTAAPVSVIHSSDTFLTGGREPRAWRDQEYVRVLNMGTIGGGI